MTPLQAAGAIFYVIYIFGPIVGIGLSAVLAMYKKQKVHAITFFLFLLSVAPNWFASIQALAGKPISLNEWDVSAMVLMLLTFVCLIPRKDADFKRLATNPKGTVN